MLGQVFPPPPPGGFYSNLPANSVIASSGNFDESGYFSIEADISSLLSTGEGVYTIALIAVAGGKTYNLTNYSIWVD